MTDSFIDVGQSSKKSASKVEAAAFPSKNLLKKKSLYTLPSTKVEAVHSSKFKKEEVDDFKEAINEKMKYLEVKKSGTAAAGDMISDSVAAFTSQSRKRKSSDSVAAGRFRVFVSGFCTGAEDIDKALGQHFENCGGIERISVNDRAGYAYINFTNLESLLKALQPDKTSFRGRPLTIYRMNANKSTFRASIRWPDTGAPKPDVLQTFIDHFKICGEIEDIGITSPGYAVIDFESLASRDKALEFNKTKVGDHLVTVKEVISSMRRLRAEIRGFDTSADPEEVHEALKKHFKECGRIEGLSVGARYACIDFASLDSLFKAFELNNTKVGGHLITVRPPGIGLVYTSEFMADIRWTGDIGPNALRSSFEQCGGIAGIYYDSKSAMIYFTNSEALKNALDLNGSRIGESTIFLYECNFDDGCSCDLLALKQIGRG